MILQENASAHLRLDVELYLKLPSASFKYLLHGDSLETLSDYGEPFVSIVHVGFQNHPLFALVKMQLHVLEV